MSFLNLLIGQAVHYIGRACDMLCVPIGDTVSRSIRGNELTKYEIHLQCAWRLLDSQKKIIVASRDVFLPSSNQMWSESFQWDVRGGNLFDEKIEKYNESRKDLRIKDVTIGENHDLILLFNDGCAIEAFADSSIEENWRIIQRKPRSIHIVLTGNQLEQSGKSPETTPHVSQQVGD